MSGAGLTLKQEAFIEKLPKNGYNMAKTMREVGYSEQTSRSGAQYALLRARMQKAYDPERVKHNILKAERDFIKDGDNSNRSRMIELQAKIAGLTKETANTQVTAIFTGIAQDLPPLPVQQDIEVTATENEQKPSTDDVHNST